MSFKRFSILKISSSPEHSFSLLDISEQYFISLLGKSIFLTGMTGFFGYPFLKLLIYYKNLHSDSAPIYVCTRDKNAAIQRLCLIDDVDFISWIIGDIESLVFYGSVDLIIHGASTSSFDKFAGATPLKRLSTIVDGTENIIRIASSCSASRVLFISSGSVYGNSAEISCPLSETSCFGPNVTDDSEACYSEAKRFAELKLLLASESMAFDVVIARCFAFIGPLLPLNLHFSVGNFIGCAFDNTPIVLRGDGSAVRSYMYTYDLAIWLAAILTKGRNLTAYNVGSDFPVSIFDLSHIVRDVLNPSLSVTFSSNQRRQLNRNTSASSFYVPSIERAKSHLGVSVWTSLHESIASVSPSATC